jgi:hypothetical protein
MLNIAKLAVNFKHFDKKGFLASGTNRKTSSWPEGRKEVDHPGLQHDISIHLHCSP